MHHRTKRTGKLTIEALGKKKPHHLYECICPYQSLSFVQLSRSRYISQVADPGVIPANRHCFGFHCIPLVLEPFLSDHTLFVSKQLGKAQQWRPFRVLLWDERILLSLQRKVWVIFTVFRKKLGIVWVPEAVVIPILIRRVSILRSAKYRARTGRSARATYSKFQGGARTFKSLPISALTICSGTRIGYAWI